MTVTIRGAALRGGGGWVLVVRLAWQDSHIELNPKAWGPFRNLPRSGRCGERIAFIV
ncbi:hypothetical protein [Bosea sp. AS-1]|uniref:hypothetical protein n=1 Tax=Bosea sp. AS-1 TaxID=2015316 RepID=UPI0012FE2786|nr:hypothetical protein [Bosea sp. AS-1]